MPEPIDHIEWRDSRNLKANFWNPNNVFKAELHLLEFSILDNGWLHPIIVGQDGLIIDGFHRWRLSMTSKKLIGRYEYRIPCVVVAISVPEAMLLTVRINRAKGTNSALDLSKLVRALVEDHGLPKSRIATEIGATADEIDLLLSETVFKRLNPSSYEYSKSWNVQ